MMKYPDWIFHRIYPLEQLGESVCDNIAHNMVPSNRLYLIK